MVAARTELPAADETVEPLDDDVAGEALHAESWAPQVRPHPYDGLSDARLAWMLDESPESLGSISLGSPNYGHLFNGVELPEAPEWKRIEPRNAWGTQETVDFLGVAVRRVHDEHPDTPVLAIGDISAETGGPIAPHRSHQSGRDADVGYFYNAKNIGWYTNAHQGNLDPARTWAFVRALITETDVEMILIDRSILVLLEAHATRAGEDTEWVYGLFHDAGHERAILRHARGHRTHLHVRFYNPIAQESARRLHWLLAERGLVERPVAYQSYRCVSGDTLGRIAKRFGTTVAALKRANGLRSSAIVAGKTYRIPRLGASVPSAIIPPRRLPPPPRGG